MELSMITCVIAVASAITNGTFTKRANVFANSVLPVIKGAKGNHISKKKTTSNYRTRSSPHNLTLLAQSEGCYSFQAQFLHRHHQY
jgi:hypothetical protein